MWLDLGNEGTPTDFISSLRGPAGTDGVNGIDGLSAYEIWQTLGNTGTEQDFINSLTGPAGPTGPQGETGPAGPQGPAGTSGLGNSASFWDTTTQGDDGVGVGYLADTPYPIYFNNADLNNSGISMTSGSRFTFSSAGVYNLAFSGQVARSRGGSTATITIWLRKNGIDVPDTATDLTLVANGVRMVAAWNFFIPVTCNGSCDYYQLMWSTDDEYVGIIYDGPRTAPTRPAIPSVIATVNQVK